MQPDQVDDKEFERQLERWITGFHGDVKPVGADHLKMRVKSYLRQEDLFAEKVGFVLSLLPEKPRRVLDVGSSAGGLSVALARFGLDVDGIEPSAGGVEASRTRAQRLNQDHVRFHEGVGEKLPFGDNEFDFAISLAVLEHVQDVPQVMREVFRVLKPGGYFYAEVPNYLFPFEPHYKMAWLPMMPKRLAKIYVRARGGHPEFVDTLNYMNRFILRRRFKEAGFVEIHDMYADFLTGKASGQTWASRDGRLAKMGWAAGAVSILFDVPPIAWFLNRVVCLLARKPLV